jgi:uncharacterized protein with HEPN domain
VTRRTRVLLEDIREACGLIAAYIADSDLETFAEDTQKQDAVARRIEIIGEAVKGLDSSLKEAHPDIPHGPGASRPGESRVYAE